MRTQLGAVATKLGKSWPAFLSTSAALAARFAIDPWVGNNLPYLTFFPAVAFAGYLGNLPSGIVAALLGGLLADFFFVAPRHSFLPGTTGDWIGLAGFWFGSAAICLVIHSRTQAWRKAQDAALTRLRFAGIVESAMDAIIAVDESQRVRAFNRAAEQIFGCKAREALGQPLDKFIPERFRAAHRRHVGEFGKTGVTSRSMTRPGTLWELRSNGEEFPIEATISQVEAEGQKFYTVILRDVSERERAEQVRKQLAAIVESTEDAVISKTLEGTITTWNAGAERMYGYAADEVLGKSIALLSPPERQQELAAMLEKLKQGYGIAQYETVRQRKDGSLVDVSITVSPVHDEQGRITGVATIARDISERKRAEEALRERSEELAAMVERMPALVWMAHDAECRKVTGNAAAAEFFGLEPQANVSQTPGERPAVALRHLDATGRELRPEELPIQRAAATGRTVEDAELQLELPDGRRAWILGNATPLFSAEGKVRGVLSTFFDVTARKKAEAELQASQERLQLAQRAAAMGTWEWDIGAGRVMWSDEVCELHGIPAGGFDGRFESWLRTVHPDDRERAQAAVREGLARGGVYSNEYRTLLPDGRVTWTVARGQFFNDESGRPARLVGICMDLTERKRAEELLHEAERIVATGRMAATLAHEINNPLAAITNLAYLLRAHAQLPADVQAYATLLDEELRRISQIVRQTLNLYRQDVKASPECRLDKSVDHVLQFYAERLRGMTVSVRCQEGCVLTANEAEIHQMLSNLVLNAAEAMPNGGGRLSIRVRPGREWRDGGRRGVRILVADTGAGIEGATRRRMFEPFFSTKPQKGVGLGLSVVQWVVAQYSGALRVRSSTRPGRSGTCVSVFLCAGDKKPATAEPSAKRQARAS